MSMSLQDELALGQPVRRCRDCPATATHAVRCECGGWWSCGCYAAPPPPNGVARGRLVHRICTHPVTDAVPAAEWWMRFRARLAAEALQADARQGRGGEP